MLDRNRRWSGCWLGEHRLLHLSDRHDFWPVDRQRAAFVDQHRGTQRQHVLDPVGCRPIWKADDEPVVGGERDDRCLVGATQTATLMADDGCVCPWLAGEGTLQPVRERPIEPGSRRPAVAATSSASPREPVPRRNDPAEGHTQHEKRSPNHPSPHRHTPTRTVRVVVSSNAGSGPLICAGTSGRSASATRQVGAASRRGFR